MNRRGLLGMLAGAPVIGAVFFRADAEAVEAEALAKPVELEFIPKGPVFVLDPTFQKLLMLGEVKLPALRELTWRMLEPDGPNQRWLGAPQKTRVHWEPDRLTLMVDDTPVFTNDEENVDYRVDKLICTIDGGLMVGSIRTDLVITTGNTLTMDFGPRGLFTMGGA